MAEGSLIYKPNLSQLTWKEEATFKAAAVQGAQTVPFGVIDEEVRLPDPEINFFAHPNLGEGADLAVVAPGARTLSGSIPFAVQNGKMLAFLLGACDTTGAAPPYTHAITGAETLPSMVIEAVYGDGTNDFLRYYRGVKVSGGRLSAEEEGELKLALDIEAAYAEASTDAKSTLVPVTTKPYSFHQGACTFWGTTFARVLNWSIDVKRALKPRRYIQSSNGAFPYEINEGKRNIELSATIVAADDVGSGTHGTGAMEELLSPTAAGFDISLLLTRGASDTITISNPTAKKCHLKSAPHPLGQGEDAPISISVLMKGVEISVVDAISAYPGE